MSLCTWHFLFVYFVSQCIHWTIPTSARFLYRNLFYRDLSWPYTRQLLSPVTWQHHCSCMLRMEISHGTFYKSLGNRRLSILKQLVECSIRYFHAQHARTMMLPCRRQQKLPHVWSALVCIHMYTHMYTVAHMCIHVISSLMLHHVWHVCRRWTHTDSLCLCY